MDVFFEYVNASGKQKFVNLKQVTNVSIYGNGTATIWTVSETDNDYGFAVPKQHVPRLIEQLRMHETGEWIERLEKLRTTRGRET